MNRGGANNWALREFDFDHQTFFFHFKIMDGTFCAWASILGGKTAASRYKVVISASGKPGSIKLKLPVMPIDARVANGETPPEDSCLSMNGA